MTPSFSPHLVNTPLGIQFPLAYRQSEQIQQEAPAGSLLQQQIEMSMTPRNDS